ncbi:MAG: nicotinate-nucleotide adenylyltransferase [Candidatus Ancillula sp.]|jgi:nicotinate-nucleotide adenylyltransferase|nr:nicotinate-nucleotide adenylyltransferase [Candidatus Ancillula sp.]
MKIGIFGGTFDPPHLGHLTVADELKSKLNLDAVFFVPANMHKFKASAVSPEERVAGLEQFLEDNGSEHQVSRVDILRGGVTYSIDTAQDFRHQFPDAELFFIAGSDVLDDLPNWKDFALLTELVNFIVVNRPGFEVSDIPNGVTLVEINSVDISSTKLRKLHKIT